ncbi:aspartic peptidase domain-containing protein [Schizophyllum amplum]|uniref:Aspartic peptidase domain-containing protein n=1 Tax=Schizophyllum amplum TaxID=97359 RepID=A0A550C817_9AGAR|nr:aspartic peptidase domain-containing protein [Auriculariopsis ampla]
MRALVFFTCFPLSALAIPLYTSIARHGHDIPPRARRTNGGLHMPLVNSRSPRLSKRGESTGAIGLGDYLDVTYNVLLNVGGQEMPLVLDTGSADLWVISDRCTDCNTTQAQYPQDTFTSNEGLTISLQYGDSISGTHADGLIGTSAVSVAGLQLEDQYFAAINSTNTSVVVTDSSGIFGLGFPINSAIWRTVFVNAANSGNVDRRQSSALTDSVIASYDSQGPFVARLVANEMLADPMFAVTLQRDTIDHGGSVGMLSLGELPSGVSNDSLTWLPLRTYAAEQGGLSPPSNSPDEEYPFTWEVFLDAVYLDGEQLPQSTLANSTIAPSALLDTGNSLLRGPADVVQTIIDKLGGDTISCGEPHTLEFEFGGKRFAVDPRDFVAQAYEGSTNECAVVVAATDTPTIGEGYLYSWSLGIPFLKSVLSAYHFGDLAYPSRDAPRVGLLSTVPDDAADLYRAAFAAASASGDLYSTIEAAPTGTMSAFETNEDGVALASSTATPTGDNGAGDSNAGIVVSVNLVAVAAALLAGGVMAW